MNDPISISFPVPPQISTNVSLMALFSVTLNVLVAIVTILQAAISVQCVLKDMNLRRTSRCVLVSEIKWSSSRNFFLSGTTNFPSVLLYIASFLASNKPLTVHVAISY